MARFALVVAVAFGLCHGFVGLPHLAGAAPAGQIPAAETVMAQGWNAWQRGAFEEAARSWQDAAQRYARAGQPRAQSVALTQLARAYQALGQYRKAEQSLASALELAQQAGDRVQIATVFGSLGGTYFVSGALDAAQQALQEGLRLARELGHTALMAAMLNDLGNVFTSQNKYAEALDAYGESARVAAQQHDRALAVRALTNAAMVSQQQGQYQATRSHLDMAWAQTQDAPPSHDNAYSFINIGLAYASLSATRLRKTPSSLSVPLRH